MGTGGVRGGIWREREGKREERSVHPQMLMHTLFFPDFFLILQIIKLKKICQCFFSPYI